MDRSKQQHAILVDPFSSGQYLVDEFNRRGTPCVAVLSNDIASYFVESFQPEKYADVIKFSGDFEKLVKSTKKFNPMCVMAGIETGVGLMDKLAAHLDLPGNDQSTSVARRDKYVMQEVIREKGMCAVEQCKVTCVEEAQAWLENYQKFPVVVKPAESAGSDNIHFCGSRDETLSAVEKILGSNNLFECVNEHALIQEYLEGQEWAVDIVSCKGACQVTNVTKYKKTRTSDGKLVYRHSAFHSPNVKEHGELISYTKEVVAALGIDYGAAHVEIIRTERGPVLVEVNARMHGGDAVVTLKSYAPYTQLDLSVDAFVAPEKFLEKTKQEVIYSHHVIAHFLISKMAGKVNEIMQETRLREISSYVSEHMPKLGASLKITDSLTSAPGYIWLANAKHNLLEDDQRKLIDWEDQGLLYS